MIVTFLTVSASSTVERIVFPWQLGDKNGLWGGDLGESSVFKIKI